MDWGLYWTPRVDSGDAPVVLRRVARMLDGAGSGLSGAEWSVLLLDTVLHGCGGPLLSPPRFVDRAATSVCVDAAGDDVVLSMALRVPHSSPPGWCGWSWVGDVAVGPPASSRCVALGSLVLKAPLCGAAVWSGPPPEGADFEVFVKVVSATLWTFADRFEEVFVPSLARLLAADSPQELAGLVSPLSFGASPAV